MKTFNGIVKNGKIELPPDEQLPEGAQVTVIITEDTNFWTEASEPALAKIWDNTEDDIYAQLLR
ncbi:Similarity [Microcystis aeruginosa PCC 9432]|jgi:hypothetical protein|uniref:Similarity n=4 Tax=Microcystis aeruginosa TaxID=1126 RepID=A0A822L8W7_MICAE|nr:hypothetical protein [Microcystis aeruginosa]MEB3249885.1 hypothetical protein [Merismopediaceae bacterium]MDB9394571.1 hypothetical protein [Microcystis aeruginosa CS-573]TYT69071.1 hypothetical protein FXO09_22685 [Microcystis aeruginosa KLA2]CCH92542.1 Similarity [Microcystis aeruginosa PCC 9432]CCI26354.1 Similarity [Microcystis aeruginosa PCC 9808]